MPNPLNLPSGCIFKRRCPVAMPVCDSMPPVRQLEGNHISRCWLEPDGSPPAIGADATPAVAEKAAEEISVEPLVLPDPEAVDLRGSAS